MSARSAGGPAPAGPLAKLTALAAVLGALAVLAPQAKADPRTDYMLDCMGCHLADAAGVPGKVPDMRNSLVPLSRTAAGRRYLVQVPGVAQSPLSNRDLAVLLNWMMHHLSAQAVPKSFRPFTAAEVAAYRKTPLVDVVGARRRLLGAAPKPPASRRGDSSLSAAGSG